MTTPNVAPGSTGSSTAAGRDRDAVHPGRAAAAAVGSGDSGTIVAPGKVPPPQSKEVIVGVGVGHGLAIGHTSVFDSHALIDAVVLHGLRLGDDVGLRVADPPNAAVTVS